MATTSTPKLLKRGALPWADRNDLLQADRLLHAGKPQEAEPLLRQVLRRHPGSFDALFMAGRFAQQVGRADEAIELLRAALASDAEQPDALLDLGRALQQRGELDAALGSVEIALGIAPDHDEARLAAAGWLVQAGRAAAAERLLAPLVADAGHGARGAGRAGHAARALGRLDDALRHFETQAELEPGETTGWVEAGETLMRIDRWAEAALAFERALRIDASSVRALRGLAFARLRLGDPAGARELALRARPGEPRSLATFGILGEALIALGRDEEAADAFRLALRIDAQHVPSLTGFAHALWQVHRAEDAALAFERLLALAPDTPYVKGKLLHCKMLVADWLKIDELQRDVERDLDADLPAAEPFGLQGWCADPVRLQRAARVYAAREHPVPASLRPPAPFGTGPRIRIGYVGGEFRRQATSILMVRLLELHDRERFEVFAFDSGHADDSEERRRIERAVAEVVPIAGLRVAAAADAVRERGIDILINLNGYFGRGRNDLFALRPAPVQVSYLGFPGTLGAPWMDYIVADATVVPPGDEARFDEAVVRLPDSYQPNDDRRARPAARTQRGDHGLPDGGFVFACFNNAYKITPSVFGAWMRLLAAVPGSVLWLLDGEEALRSHLAAQAPWHGVDPARLIFAPFVDPDLHLERLRHADLVLDTLPYNAHTTGSDALWAGVPMLTCIGTAFAGRVGASLLRAVGLPELISESLEAYEARALHLATHPAELAALRRRLAAEGPRSPLFDSDRYRRHFEAALLQMAGRARAGLVPAAITVAPVAQPAAAEALTP